MDAKKSLMPVVHSEDGCRAMALLRMLGTVGLQAHAISPDVQAGDTSAEWPAQPTRTRRLANPPGRRIEP